MTFVTNFGFEDSCLICLQTVLPANTEQFKLLNFILNYLKITDKLKLKVCEKCGEILRKFRMLCDTLEKVRLEMDYLLGSIKCVISNSSQCSQSQTLSSVREEIVKKCGKQMKCPKAQINLQRLDISNHVKTRCQSPTCEYSDLDADDDSNSRLSNASAAPIVDEMKDIKMEISLEDVGLCNNGKKCPKCSKIFKRRQDMQRHVEAVHLHLKPFKCSTCSKTFTLSKGLRRHISVVHLHHKPYQCDICGMSFGYKQHFQNHTQVVHNNAESFKCSTCQKVFKHSANLQSHIKAVHLLIKPHKCDRCDKAFTDARDLKRHKLLPHDKSKNFLCKICNKRYCNRNSLNKHKRYVHLKIFPKFECDICKKVFNAPSNLKSHFSAIHEKRRYFCKSKGCERNYASSYQLRNHYRMDHPGFKVPEEPSEDPNLIIKNEEEKV